MRTLPTGLLALASALAAGPAGAATFAVDSTADAVDASPGDGLCATTLGDCTLRAAVMETNALAGADHIDLPAGIYTLAIPGDVENESASGDLDVTGALTVQGDGLDETVIDAAGLDRGIDVFFFFYRPSPEASLGVTIRDLTVRDGFVGQTSDDFGNGGGGIRGYVASLDSHLTLDRVAVRDNFSTWGGGGLSCGGEGRCRVNDGVVSGNETAGWGGGGILGPYFSTVSIDGTEITGNTARHGAGIYKAEFANLDVRSARIASNVGDSALFVEGSVSIANSVIEHNQATGMVTGLCYRLEVVRTTLRGNVGEKGGGARLVGSEECNMWIHDSAIYDNESLGDGGGILIEESPWLALWNTTVSGNRAAGVGGGIAVSAHGSWPPRPGVGLTQMTITRNSARHGGGVWFGLANVHHAQNSIVAQNPGGDCVAGEAGAQVESQGYNLIGDASECNWTPASGDQLGTAAAPIDAMLGPLSWWSGPTLMHAPLPGSPAIDAGNPAAPSETGTACSTTDQRGVARPIDGDGMDGARCDIGAMEAPWPRPTACGLGAELVLALGALRAWSRRRA